MSVTIQYCGRNYNYFGTIYNIQNWAYLKNSLIVKLSLIHFEHLICFLFYFLIILLGVEVGYLLTPLCREINCRSVCYTAIYFLPETNLTLSSSISSTYLLILQFALCICYTFTSQFNFNWVSVLNGYISNSDSPSTNKTSEMIFLASLP